MLEVATQAGHLTRSEGSGGLTRRINRDSLCTGVTKYLCIVRFSRIRRSTVLCWWLPGTRRNSTSAMQVTRGALRVPQLAS